MLPTTALFCKPQKTRNFAGLLACCKHRGSWEEGEGGREGEKLFFLFPPAHVHSLSFFFFFFLFRRLLPPTRKQTSALPSFLIFLLPLLFSLSCVAPALPSPQPEIRESPSVESSFFSPTQKVWKEEECRKGRQSQHT